MDEALQKKIDALPPEPGVYVMKDASGRIIYVGKAINLRDRVKSYFGPADMRPFVQMLPEILSDVEVIITRTDREAYLLENELIKKHLPRFNAKLRDDKNFLSLRVDLRDEFPRVERVRRPKKDGARYFGPFVSAREAKYMLRTANLRFGLRTCSEVNFRNRSRPCLQGQMRRCLAPCAGGDDLKKPYAEAVGKAVLLLSGRDRELRELLAADMKRAAQRLDFEEAAALRDTIAAMEESRDRQGILDLRLPDTDVIGFAFDGSGAAVCILGFRNGRLATKRCFDFEDTEQSAAAILPEILVQNYDGRGIPGEIMTGEIPDGREALESILSERAGIGVRLVTAGAGSGRLLMEMAVKNADHHLSMVSDRNDVLDGVRKRFGLRRFPRRIECYDISHLGGTDTVAARVTFINGSPEKQLYRHYHIRADTRGDDTAAMHEVLLRRLKSPGEDAPDLILVDGGRGQLNAAIEALVESGPGGRIDVLAIAKGDRKSGDSIYIPGRKNPVRPGARSRELHMLMRIRDESHRFGRSFQQRTRESGALPG